MVCVTCETLLIELLQCYLLRRSFSPALILTDFLDGSQTLALALFHSPRQTRCWHRVSLGLCPLDCFCKSIAAELWRPGSIAWNYRLPMACSVELPLPIAELQSLLQVSMKQEVDLVIVITPDLIAIRWENRRGQVSQRGSVLDWNKRMLRNSVARLTIQ